MDFIELSDGDLRTFTRALHEARFAEVELDPHVWTSPFVVQLHADLLAEQMRRLGESGNLAGLSQFREWLVWRGRPEHATILRRIAENVRLRKAISDDPTVMNELLAPFLLDSDLLREFADAARDAPESS